MKYKNIFSLLEEITEHNGEKTALGSKTSLGWSEFTYKGLGLLSRRLACYLINDIQVPKKSNIAILSESKPEYAACFFGALLSGLTVVPLDNKLTIYELKSILTDAEPVVLFASAANYDRALELKNTIPFIKHVVLMDNYTNPEGFESLYSIPKNYLAKWRRRPLSDAAFIIYTSGTTGSPKGVQTTYKNMLAQMHDLNIIFDDIFSQKKDIRLLSILPMNHLFELTVGFFTNLHRGYSIFYAKSLKPNDILDSMNEKKINFIVTVPAFLKLLKTSIESDISKKDAISKSIFKAKLFIAKYLPFAIRKFMFGGILKKFGGEFFGCISGGAPLDIKVGTFFDRIGVKIYQGYGLSEASPVVTMNDNKYRNLKSVGRALASFEAKIDPDTGELLVKGPSVMKGYFKRPDLTAEVIEEDGWLHTGDIAEIDKHGLIYITGRIKNMIVLSGGKKVFPEEVESVIEKSPYFQEVCALGSSKTFGEKDGAEEVAVIVVPKEEILARFNDKKELENACIKEVRELSKRLAHYKRPVRIIVRTDVLPKTTTNKLRRKEIKELLSKGSI